MSANPTIYTTLLAFVLGGSALVAQSPSTALPNAPMTQSPFVASAQAGSVTNSPSPVGAEGTPTPLTRQEAERLALGEQSSHPHH
jgi:outer membrane protein